MNRESKVAKGKNKSKSPDPTSILVYWPDLVRGLYIYVYIYSPNCINILYFYFATVSWTAELVAIVRRGAWTAEQ